jgi:general stress protein 26
MAVAKISPEGDFYLVSKILSEKVHELQIDPHATLTFQSDPVKHVCLSGQVSISADKSQIRSLWNIFLDTWFENGPEASSVALLQFKPSYAEYWDHSGTKALRYAFECAKSRVTGGTPDIPEPDMHGSCKL